MPPVETDAPNFNAIPIAVFSAQILGIGVCVADILNTFLKAARQLSPSQDTRLRQARRRRAIITFASLATLGFVIAGYFELQKRALSYRLWAEEHGEKVSDGLWSALRGNSTHTLQLGRWWKDTNLLRDNYGAIFVRSRRAWWSQQYFLGLTLWTVFLGIEGARRAIPTRTIIAFVLLSQLVGLSAAQNLFSILVALTPVPLAQDARIPADSPTVSPHHTLLPILHNAPAAISIISILLVPFPLAKRFYMLFMAWNYIIAPMYMALIARVAPRSCFWAHRTVHAAHKSHTVLFRSIAFFTFILHAQQTLIAVLDNAPRGPYLRYDYVWNMHLNDMRIIPKQAHTAVAKILDALNEHPAVGAIGYDILLSTFSLCVWAILRDLNVENMLECSSLGWLTGKHRHADKPDEKRVSFERRPSKSITPVLDSPPAKRLRGRPRKSESNSTPLPSTPQRRRVSKSLTPQPEDDSDDDDYVPPPSTRAEVERMEHEEEPEKESLAENVEAGALSWGLFVLGGFGAVSAAVLGAEVTSK